MEPTTKRRKKTWKPMHRATAEGLLNGVLARAALLNARTSPYAWRVLRIYVFGSYLKGQQRPNDLDLIIVTERRYGPGGSPEQRKAEDARRSASQKQFRTYLDYVFWPQVEVLRHLKGPSARVSLHESDHLTWLRERGEPLQLVFGEPE